MPWMECTERVKNPSGSSVNTEKYLKPSSRPISLSCLSSLPRSTVWRLRKCHTLAGTVMSLCPWPLTSSRLTGQQILTRQTPSLGVCDDLNKNWTEAHFCPFLERSCYKNPQGKKAVREDRRLLSSGFGKKRSPFVYKTADLFIKVLCLRALDRWYFFQCNSKYLKIIKLHFFNNTLLMKDITLSRREILSGLRYWLAVWPWEIHFSRPWFPYLDIEGVTMISVHLPGLIPLWIYVLCSEPQPSPTPIH